MKLMEEFGFILKTVLQVIHTMQSQNHRSTDMVHCLKMCTLYEKS